MGIPLWIDIFDEDTQAAHLSRFTAFLARSRLNSWSTIKGKVGAVRWMHRLYRQVELVGRHPVLTLVGNGCKRSLARSRPWEPVTVEMLRSLASRYTGTLDAKTKILWGCLQLSFFFLERGGEVWGSAHSLQMSNVTLWEEEKKVWKGNTEVLPKAITIRWPTDKTHSGAEVTMFASGDKELCPVRAMLLVLQGRALLNGKPKPLSMAVCSGTSKSAAVKAIRWAAVKCGVTENLDRYVLHSLRVGGTTQLAAAGCQEMIIRMHGRWRSTTIRGYARRLRGTFVGVAGDMVRENQEEADAWGRGSRSPI